MKRRAPSKRKTPPPSSPADLPAPEPAWAEIRRLEYLFEQAPRGEAFRDLRYASKWGEGIRHEVLKPLQRGDKAAIEDAIVFLEENPRFFRSGYHKRALAASLKSAELSADQIARLRQVILTAAASPNVGPEFSEYARLAIQLADHRFIGEVAARIADAEGWVKKRLERILRLTRAHQRR